MNQGGIANANTLQRDGGRVPDELVYNGATHWSAMLEDIEELRSVIRENDEIDDGASIEPDNHESDGINILFGTTKPLPFKQVLSYFLPPRDEADRLVAAYFRAKTIAAPFVHATQFSKLYRLFWDDPSIASPLWASILFSVFDIATRALSTRSRATLDDNGKANGFTIAAAHCLAFGEYHEPQRFAIEALLLYAQSRCIMSGDISPSVAVLFGTLVRLATVMGYHRELYGHRGNISVFEVEMRRRTWSLLMQLDLLVSFQLGLPSNIQFPTWDTRPPTNLLDSDFDEDTTQLPPARPDSEPTELLFYIVKHRLMAVFEKILRHTLSVTDRPGEELEAIDQELRETHAALPTALQYHRIADSIVDPPAVIVTRLCVDFIYQKCLCVLHRRYVTAGRPKSIQTCYDSASSLVSRFLDFYKEFESGGQLETERWLMGSITWHDFLLGCTVLCLTICSTKYRAAGPASTSIVDVVVSTELLQNAKAICEAQSTRSKDTKKVQRLIEATVLKSSTQDNRVISTTQVSWHGGQDMASNTHWWEGSSSQDNKEWSWEETFMGPMENSGWTYMEQFLNLPNEDFMIDT